MPAIGLYKCSREVCGLGGHLLSDLKTFCQGLHVIAVEREAEIRHVLELAAVHKSTT